MRLQSYSPMPAPQSVFSSQKLASPPKSPQFSGTFYLKCTGTNSPTIAEINEKLGELYSKKAIDYGFIAVDVKPKSTTPKDQTPDSQTFYSICFVNWKRSLVARLESYVLFKPKDDFSNKVLAFESDLLNGLLTAYPRLQQIQWKDIPSDLQPHHHRPE